MAEPLSTNDQKFVHALLEHKKEESLFIGAVTKIDPKNKKQRRLIVVTPNRIYSLKPSGGKIAREAHWLELLSIQSSKKDEIHFTFKGFKLAFISDQADDILFNVRSAYGEAFPGIPEKDRYKLDVTPSSRVNDLSPSDQPLGGFITTYKSLCNFFPGTEVRQDVIWDLENLFIPGNIKEFSLNELEQPISANDLKPLLAALQYNTYFKGLSSKDFNIDKNVLQGICDTLKTNSSLDELDFSKSGITKEGLTQISESLASNKNLQLTSINISNNNIEDKGMHAFATYLGGLNRGLVKLDISNCGVSKAGMTALCNALKKNAHMSSTLTFFDLSNNKLEAEGSASLAAFLANTNSVRVLLLSNTAANLEVILGAIQRGCNELQQLDLSGNKFTSKSVSLPKYLQGSAHLSNLNLSNTLSSVDSYKEIVLAMSSNIYLKDCVVNLSRNNLGPAGARVLSTICDKMNNIQTLDLGDNEFGEEGVSIIAAGLCNNTYIKNLSLASNFKGKPGKGRLHAIESLVSLIGSECPLEHLNLSAIKGAELKLDIVHFLYSLATNETLKSLDISGNQMGNKGATALGKAIQTNESLETLKWDGNLVTLQGYQGFNNGLRRNHTLKNMPMPINDVSACLKGNEAQGTIDIVNQMERTIQRNQSPTAKFQGSSEMGSGNQFTFLSSGQREAVQKTVFKIKSTGRKITDTEKKLVLDEAENQDNVMTSLYSVKDQIHQEFEVELNKALVEATKLVSPLFGKLKSKLISEIAGQVSNNYKSFEQGEVRRLQTNLAYGGKDLPEDEFERVIVNSATAELSNKANQAFHSTVSIASDYLYEKIHDKLSDILFELTETVAQEQAQATAEELKNNTKPTTKPVPPPVGNKPTSSSSTPTKTDSSTPPTKTQPKIPPKVKKPTGPPPKGTKPTSSSSKQGEDEVHVESLPKVESNLSHATKERAAPSQKRKPPTRKPRPPPPSGTTM